ncbi:MAG: GUN4 domain-containing protein [Bacteroidales bacterium]|nr:GUN4 domain-containing protein [Bacteroidales bacterium]
MKFGNIIFILITIAAIVFRVIGAINNWVLIVIIIAALLVGTYFNGMAMKLIDRKNYKKTINEQKRKETIRAKVKLKEREYYNNSETRFVKLFNLLENKQYGAADRETLTILLQAVEQEDYLSKDHIMNLQPEIFKKIDQLWMQKSNGRFGFTAQKEVWDNGGKSDTSKVPETIDFKLYGWNVNQYTQPVFDPGNYEQLPKGYYPLICLMNIDPFSYSHSEMFGSGNYMKSPDYRINDALKIVIKKYRKCFMVEQ